jgi:hypothetical protein
LENISPDDIKFSKLSSVPPFSQQLTLKFAKGSFGSESVVRFGVDRDETALSAGGNSADLLAGGTISGVVSGPDGDVPFNGSFSQALRNGYSTMEGLGLIDALSAVRSVP